MKLSKILLPVLLIRTLLLPEIAQAKPVNCEYKKEEASTVNRVVPLENMGIKIAIPSNYRAIAREDGSIEIVDPGIYGILNCLANNPGATAADIEDYPSIVISEVPMLALNEGAHRLISPNIFINLQITQVGNSRLYRPALRIVTEKTKGVIEVRESVYGGINTEKEAREYMKRLIELAKHIEVI